METVFTAVVTSSVRERRPSEEMERGGGGAQQK